MNTFSIHSNSVRAFHFLQYGAVFILGIGIGLATALYSSLLVIIGTALFALFAIALYGNSISPVMSRVSAPSVGYEDRGIKSKTLFWLFALTFFLSITIPKSGKTISNIPITTANVCILAILLYWTLHLLISKNIIFQIPASKILLIFILYAIMMVLNGLMYQNQYKSILLEFVTFIGFIPVYFLVCTVVQTKKHLNILIGLIVIGMTLVCTYGVLQRKIGFERVAIPGITEQYNLIMYAEFGGRWNWTAGGGQKLYSTFQNGNIFGNHLATFIPFLGGMLFAIRSFWKKALFSSVFILAWYALIFTYSRGALVGTISGFLFLILISKKKRIKTILVACIIISVLLMLGNYFAERPEFARYDFQKITTEPDRFTAGRINRAIAVWNGYKVLPLHSQIFGLGFGGVLRSSNLKINYVDNLYLTFLFKTGIVGLSILCVVFVKLLWKILELRDKTQDIQTRALINGGLAGLAASLVHNLADMLWFFPPLAANFWFLAGITMMIGVIETREAASNVSHVELTKPKSVNYYPGQQRIE